MSLHQIKDAATAACISCTPHKKSKNGWNLCYGIPSTNSARTYAVLDFPVMNAPFENCNPPPNATSKLRSLTVDFKQEDTKPELQAFRVLLESIHGHLVLLCTSLNGGQQADVAPLIKPSKDIDYYDLVSLRFWPGAAKFFGESNQPLLEQHITDFRDYRVKVQVVLKDIWLHNGVYFPRLFLRKCTLVQKED